MITYKKALSERVSRSLFYIGCSFSYGWGIGVTSQSWIKGITGATIFMLVFAVCVSIETLVRKDG